MRNKLWTSVVWLVVLALLLAPLFAVGCTAAPKATKPPEQAAPAVIKWKMQSYGEPGTEFYNRTGPPLADLVRKMSNGRLDITVYPAGSLVPSADILTATGQGVVDAAIGCPGYWTGDLPVADVEGAFPYTFREADDIYAVMHQYGMLDILRKAYAERNVYYVNCMPDDGASIISRVPINSVDDLKGKKIRGIGTMIKALGKAGAATTWLPGSELYTAMGTGVIDALFYGGVSTEDDMKFYEVCKYVILPYITDADVPTNFLVNMKKWNELPDDLKAIYQTAVDSMWTVWYDFSRTENMKDLAVWQKKYGIQVITWPDSSIAKMQVYTKEIMDEMSKADPKYSAPAIKALQDYLTAVGYWK